MAQVEFFSILPAYEGAIFHTSGYPLPFDCLSVWIMSAGLLILGGVLIAFTLREMFRDLFHPSRSGTLSEFVTGSLYASFRPYPSWLTLAGPLALVVIIMIWALLLATGFAFIYFGTPEAAYRVDAGIPGPHDSFWTAFYFSLEVMTTLGLGDIRPLSAWLRVLTTLHTLLGFALVTASLTWVILIYPALSRVRLLATTAALLADAEQRTGIRVVCPGAEDLVANFIGGVVMFRVDLIHFPIVYYFRSATEIACLARNLGIIERFARQAAEECQPDGMRVAGVGLMRALDLCAEVLARRLRGVDCHDRIAVFRAYAEQHARTLAG